MAAPPDSVPESFQRIEESPEFHQLRSSFRNFAFPVTAGFVLWYLLYVLLSCYAPGFMSTKVVGNINVALVLGILQFVSTFAIAAWYARFAGRQLDPRAAAIRGRAEAAVPGQHADRPAVAEEAAE
ncbi:DUF485 domain-containing protein [Streptomyces sp. TLI_171]|uniref:DUF485 domain-containing protein n=1 Tax=Streptomyces sp. TLI_171 TaxID=1938859 RepID=UPI000C19CAFE|nr:DUF485 domain-containing protein [Streptomyces sp. TLI_171]RKE21812.1 uncharacterized membrane protein (DUF485 family) [Streptomyces sp. TLI_171]